ncbi:hypothetical protein MTBBW1_1540014 [Desulfamplus magnetovallimortis]|uniref:Uncharacterized protein n=1 Tax=Desulfamplus magnetovallimortis TaxID=1246637 RepID=A0A1W1H8U0_9BACT|nr:hypothetical protein [Desulfamplus magnetovallimortis]SLM28788.1 hypothetical protein MTBBW1_1540014 [Desulfamplus magnetovallimortis]
MHNKWDDHDIDIFDTFGSDNSLYRGWEYHEKGTISSPENYNYLIQEQDSNKFDIADRIKNTPISRKILMECLLWLETSSGFSVPFFSIVKKLDLKSSVQKYQKIIN